MKKLIGDLRRIARADFKPKLSANLRKLKDKVVEAAYLDAGFQPPEPASFAGQAAGNAASLKDLFEVCVAEGFLVHMYGRHLSARRSRGRDAPPRHGAT